MPGIIKDHPTGKRKSRRRRWTAAAAGKEDQRCMSASLFIQEMMQNVIRVTLPLYAAAAILAFPLERRTTTISSTRSDFCNCLNGRGPSLTLSLSWAMQLYLEDRPVSHKLHSLSIFTKFFFHSIVGSLFLS